MNTDMSLRTARSMILVKATLCKDNQNEFCSKWGTVFFILFFILLITMTYQIHYISNLIALQN